MANCWNNPHLPRTSPHRSTLLQFPLCPVTSLQMTHSLLRFYQSPKSYPPTFHNGFLLCVCVCVSWTCKYTLFFLLFKIMYYTEKFYPDGSKETVFPDGTVTWLKNGCEKTVFPDGTTVNVKRLVSCQTLWIQNTTNFWFVYPIIYNNLEFW
jgi:hypothetical protein